MIGILALLVLAAAWLTVCWILLDELERAGILRW